MAQGKWFSIDICECALSAIKSFGAAAKAARLEAGGGQSVAAERLGVHVQTNGRIESGEATVAIGHVFGLIALYDVSVSCTKTQPKKPHLLGPSPQTKSQMIRIFSLFSRGNSGAGCTLDHAIERFHKDPVGCFAGLYGTQIWGTKQVQDVYVKSFGWHIGYVQNVWIDHRNEEAKIGHIAVDSGLEGRGIGRRLALAVQAELVRRYQVKRLIFQERSTKYEQAGYAQLFTSLGAYQRPTKLVRPGREDWVWPCR